MSESMSLEELEAAVRAADAAYVAYAERVAAERRALFPGAERVAERAVWPQEQADELSRLRDIRLDLYRRLWALREQQHPLAARTAE